MNPCETNSNFIYNMTQLIGISRGLQKASAKVVIKTCFSNYFSENRAVYEKREIRHSRKFQKTVRNLNIIIRHMNAI